MECSKVQLLIKDIAGKGEDQEERDKRVVEPNNSNGLQLYRIKRFAGLPHIHVSRPTSPSIYDYNTSCYNNVPMIHALLIFPMRSFLRVSHLYVFLFFSLAYMAC